MQEHQEKTISILNTDLILRIFLDDSLGSREHFIISLVCNLWSKLSSKNIVWHGLFSRKFSWSPIPFYSHVLIRESYKEQLSLNIELEEKCKSNHECLNDPGLSEAILQKNLARVEALLHSGHGIVVEAKESLADLFDEILNVLSASKDLPSVLIRKIFQNPIIDKSMNRFGIQAFHILCLKGKQDLLVQIFKSLGDDLLKISLFCDQDGGDLFTHLLNYPFYGSLEAYADVQTGEEKKRMEIVLEAFLAVLGNTGMHSLLTSPFCSYEEEFISFLHVLSSRIEDPDANQHFFKVFSYLEKKDYWILLKEGSNSKDIPLLHLMNCPKSFKQIIEILGDDAQEFLRYKNSRGVNFLYILLCSKKFPQIHLLETIMGPGFKDLLLNDNNNMLELMLSIELTGIKHQIIKTLKLMKKYDCMDIIQMIYESPEFIPILCNNDCLNDGDVYEISEIFDKYVPPKTFGCVLF